MSNMDKKEAIEVIKKNYPRVGISGSQFESALRTLIPELQKGIDERVIDFLRELASFDVANELYKEFGIIYTDVLYWLEMQKEFLHIKKICRENGESFIDDDEATKKAILAIKRVEEYIDRYLTNAHDMKDDDPRKDYCRGVDSTLADISDILQNIYSEKQKEGENYQMHYFGLPGGNIHGLGL